MTISDIDGVGEVVAESVVEPCSQPANQRLIEKFQQYGVRPEEVAEVGGKLSGQNFVVTGTLEHISRDQAAEKICAFGGTFNPASVKTLII